MRSAQTLSQPHPVRRSLGARNGRRAGRLRALLVAATTCGVLTTGACKQAAESAPTATATAEAAARPEAAAQPEAAGEVEAGRALWSTRRGEDLIASVPHFERATELAPELASAWSGLADSLALLGLYGVWLPADSLPQAKAAALRALELDPALAQAHASLGLARYLYDWDWIGAESSFRRALELDPGYAMAHHWYAMMLMATGRHDEAVAQVEQALAADPASRIIEVKAATVFTAAGLYQRAETQLQTALEHQPSNVMVHRELGFLRVAEGRWAEAVPAFERAAELSDGGAGTLAGLGLVLGVLGRSDEAHEVLERLRQIEERAGDAGSALAPDFEIAFVEVGLGDHDAALDRLEQALASHDPGIVYLATKPGLDRLRDEPRFLALVERLGLR